MPFKKAGAALASSLLCSTSVFLEGELVNKTGKLRRGWTVMSEIHYRTEFGEAHLSVLDWIKIIEALKEF